MFVVRRMPFCRFSSVESVLLVAMCSEKGMGRTLSHVAAFDSCDGIETCYRGSVTGTAAFCPGGVVFVDPPIDWRTNGSVQMCGNVH